MEGEGSFTMGHLGETLCWSRRGERIITLFSVSTIVDMIINQCGGLVVYTANNRDPSESGVQRMRSSRRESMCRGWLLRGF